MKISRSEELRKVHKNNITRSRTLGGGDGKPMPRDNLKESKREIQHDKELDAWWR